MELTQQRKKKRLILLETTIQIRRLADDAGVRHRINQELADKDVCTTSFVLRELIRTIIFDLLYIRTTVQEIDSKNDGMVSLRHILRVLSDGSSRYSPRAARREMLIISHIMEHYDGCPVSGGELTTFLDWVVREWIEEFFEISNPDGGTVRIGDEMFFTALDDHPNEVIEILLAPTGLPKTILFPPRASEFLRQRRDLVEVVMANLAGLPQKDVDKRLIDTLLWCKNEKTGEFHFERLSPQTRKGWALGDLLIALEAPASAEIYTTDHHFRPLCGALGRRIYQGFLQLPAPPETKG